MNLGEVASFALLTTLLHGELRDCLLRLSKEPLEPADLWLPSGIFEAMDGVDKRYMDVLEALPEGSQRLAGS